MSEFNQLLDKFKHLATGGREHRGPPPPVNYASRPGPPLPPRDSKSPPQATSPEEHQGVGATYEPGQWPTPELPMAPLGSHRILSDGPFTSATIQAALDQLGQNTTLFLAPGSHWIVTEPLILQLHQELATLNYPTQESEMAYLEAAEECKPHMFKLWGKTGARLRNLLIDGSREKYGWHKDCGVMLSLGHRATDQVGIVLPRLVITHLTLLQAC
jgi:hypothetical protein